MAVKIRLRRTGRKKQPSYRIVVAESTAPRDGAYLDLVGTYNPLTKPAELRIDLEKVDAWTARGAELTDTVRSLVRKARSGGDDTIALRASTDPGGRQESARSTETTPAAARPATAAPAAEVSAEPAAEAPAEPAAAEAAAGEEPARD
jgi:small subunit ribosomal protein S16